MYVCTDKNALTGYKHDTPDLQLLHTNACKSHIWQFYYYYLCSLYTAYHVRLNSACKENKIINQNV